MTTEAIAIIVNGVSTIALALITRWFIERSEKRSTRDVVHKIEETAAQVEKTTEASAEVVAKTAAQVAGKIDQKIEQNRTDLFRLHEENAEKLKESAKFAATAIELANNTNTKIASAVDLATAAGQQALAAGELNLQHVYAIQQANAREMEMLRASFEDTRRLAHNLRNIIQTAVTAQATEPMKDPPGAPHST